MTTLHAVGEPPPPVLQDSATRIYSELRELIVRGRFAPGSRIIEVDIAKRLGASRTPVRAALQRLRQEGFVIGDSPGKQLRLSVAPLTREDAREVFGILAEVEGLGARWAAEMAGERRQRLADDMDRINDALAEAGRVGTDPAEVFNLHTRFHAYYMDAIAAPRLRAIHAAIKPQAERYRRIYSNAYAQDGSASIDEHREIIGRIRRGDAEGAQHAVQTNWRNAAERLASVIEILGERGSW